MGAINWMNFLPGKSVLLLLSNTNLHSCLWSKKIFKDKYWNCNKEEWLNDKPCKYDCRGIWEPIATKSYFRYRFSINIFYCFHIEFKSFGPLYKNTNPNPLVNHKALQWVCKRFLWHDHAYIYIYILCYNMRITYLSWCCVTESPILYKNILEYIVWQHPNHIETSVAVIIAFCWYWNHAWIRYPYLKLSQGQYWNWMQRSMPELMHKWYSMQKATSDILDYKLAAL